MDLPDYDNARAAAEFLTREHVGQHRCTDGRYYSPTDYLECPTQTHVGTMLTVLWEALTLPHRAAHDTEHVAAVCAAATGLNTDELAPEDREGWLITFRLALEAHAAQLDPDVQH